MSEEPGWVPVEQAVVRCGVTRERLQRAASSGAIRSRVDARGRVLIAAEDIGEAGLPLPLERKLHRAITSGMHRAG